MRVTVTLIVAFGCPFEGRVDPAHVLRVAEGVMVGTSWNSLSQDPANQKFLAAMKKAGRIAWP